MQAELALHEHSLQFDDAILRGGNNQVIVEHYGPAILYYFWFLKWTTWLNGALTVLAVLFMLPQWILTRSQVGFSLSDPWTLFDQVFTSAYVAQALSILKLQITPLVLVWYLFVFLSLLLLSGFIVVYRRRMRESRPAFDGDVELEEHEDLAVLVVHSTEDPWSGNYDVDSKYCVNRIENYTHPPHWTRHSSPWKIYGGRFLSGFLFVLLLGAYAGVQYEVHLWSESVNSELMGHILLSVAFVALDAVWKACCQYLTFLESHTYWTTYRRSDTLKSFSFRVAAFIIFTWMGDITFNAATVNSCSTIDVVNDSNSLNCLVVYRARQMFVLLSSEALLTNATNLITTWLYNKMCYYICCAKRSPYSDLDYLSVFDLSQEYTELAFRQFVVNMTLPLVPLAPLLACIGNGTKLWVDRYKLARLCQKPDRSSSTFRNLNTLFWSLALASMLVGYPTGYLWLMFGLGG